jgi:DNA-binding CsgD family transcriptional regulator
MGVKTEMINKIHDRYTGVKKAYNVSKAEIRRLTTNVYAPGPSFYAIFNFELKRVEYVSTGLTEVLGIDPGLFKIDALNEHMHREDIAHLGKCQKLIDVFTHQILNPEEWPFYKRSFQYRLIHKDGTEKLMLHQSMLIFNQENKFLGKSFIMVSDISQFSTTPIDGVSFIDIRGHSSFLHITSEDQLREKHQLINELSARETEILRLIAEGYKSKEIADMLNISYDTVRTHRNNILKRKAFKSISQAVAYYIREGVL